MEFINNHTALFKRQHLLIILSALILVCTFLMIALVLNILKNSQHETYDWDQAVKAIVYLNPHVSEKESETLLKEIEQKKDVAKAIYISPQQGLQDLRVRTTASFLKDESANDLPGVIFVQPSSHINSLAGVDTFLKEFKFLPDVDLVKFNTPRFEKKIQKNNFFQNISYTLISLSIFISFSAVIIFLLCYKQLVLLR